MRVALSGFTGFIGQYLTDRLLKEPDIEIVGLTRRAGTSSDPRINVVQCDLFSTFETAKALKGVDVAIYLVHSMAPPSGQLSQGSFEDFDYILADNFGRACKANNIKKVIYVSGIIPTDDILSKHLKSRFEVEQVLRHWSSQVTTLRCGIVIGAGGSSFRILQTLVNRLPVMLIPSFLYNETQAVPVEDLAEIITTELRTPRPQHVSFDIANPETVTYRTLIESVASVSGKKRYLIKMPFVPVWLAKFWIRLVSGADKHLVYPLVDSLRHEMKQDPERTPDFKITFIPLDQSIEQSLKKAPKHRLSDVKFNNQPHDLDRTVRSVQRLVLPSQWDSKQVAKEYVRWIPHFFRSVIIATSSETAIHFFIFGFKVPLLELHLLPEENFVERQLFEISGGRLVSETQSGSFEFRELHDRKSILAAIHRFRPRLPWYLYRLTQAPLHAFVMSRFSKHLSRLNK